MSDLPRMGEMVTRERWRELGQGCHRPGHNGAVFKGRNRNGLRRWTTTATVVDCQPGKAFEIAITFGPLIAVANWRYEFEDTAEGCRVTESWLDHRTSFMRLLGSPMGDHSAELAAGRDRDDAGQPGCRGRGLVLRVHGQDATPTIGLLRGVAPWEPKKSGPPGLGKVKMPPSEATR